MLNKCWDFNRCTCFKQIYKGAWGESGQVNQDIKERFKDTIWEFVT